MPSARERHARPSTAKGVVAPPFIGACFEMGCPRLVFGGLHHSRMGKLYSRLQGFADYAVGPRSWCGLRADDPWRTSERIDPVCGNGCRRDPHPAKRCGLADRRHADLFDSLWFLNVQVRVYDQPEDPAVPRARRAPMLLADRVIE